MTPKGRLMHTLFKTEGREHLNIKFCRGKADFITPDQLCAEANKAILLIEQGRSRAKTEFGDRDNPTVDVRSL